MYTFKEVASHFIVEKKLPGNEMLSNVNSIRFGIRQRDIQRSFDAFGDLDKTMTPFSKTLPVSVNDFNCDIIQEKKRQWSAEIVIYIFALIANHTP